MSGSDGTRPRAGERERAGTRADVGFRIANLGADAVDIVIEALAAAPPRGSVAKRRAALRALLHDGDRWDAWLDALPALSLLALELLVEAGGALELDELPLVLTWRTGCTEDEAQRACQVLFRQQLVVPLGSDSTAREPEAVSVFEGTLPLLEARVRGLSLPDRPPELAAETEHAASDASLCRMLAVAGLTAHRTLGFTRSGTPHRGALKRFAKGLGPSNDEVFEIAEQAKRRGLLRAFGKRLLPSSRSMLAAAREGTAPTDLADWLEPGVWVSERALARALTRARVAASTTSRPDGKGMDVVLSIGALDCQSREIASLLGGIERRTVDGEVWLRRPPPPPQGERSGDGHVTTSFEVMLGPAAHPEIVATISLGCELQRIDRVLTFKITPDSVGQGLVAGLREGELRSALDAVGRNPVPDTVAQLVGEWERAGRVAPIARGWFLFAGAELAPLLEKGELAPHLLGSPMEGVLELSPTTPHDVIAAALAEHRVSPALSYPLEEALLQRQSGVLESSRAEGSHGPWATNALDDWAIDPDDEGPGTGAILAELLAELERPWPLEPGGSAALRERVAGARADGFARDLDVDLLLPAGIEGAPDATPAELVARLLALESAIDPLERAAARELARFSRKLADSHRAEFEAARASRLPLVPFLALKPKWRRRLVRTADELDELLYLTEEAFEPQRLTPAGREVLEMLEDPVTRAALDAATGDDDTDGETSPNTPHTGPRRRPAGFDLRSRDAAPNSRDAAPKRVSVVFDDARSSAPPPRPLPAADAFPELDRFELMARLAEVLEFRRSVYLLCETEGRTSVRFVSARRIEIQGSRQVLLCRDCETGEDRALPVHQIRSLMV